MASTTFAAIGFVAVAVLWLKKLRDTVSTALGETAGQQLRSNQRITETLTKLQQQQDHYEQKLQVLGEVNARLRKDIRQLADKDGSSEDTLKPRMHSRLLH